MTEIIVQINCNGVNCGNCKYKEQRAIGFRCLIFNDYMSATDRRLVECLSTEKRENN